MQLTSSLFAAASNSQRRRRGKDALPGLANSVGDFLDVGPSEAVLKTVQDFLSAVANNLRKPDAAVHSHEQGSVAQVGGLRVGRDVWIYQ